MKLADRGRSPKESGYNGRNPKPSLDRGRSPKESADRGEQPQGKLPFSIDVKRE